MYQEISILPRASVSSRQSGDTGGGGGIIGGPEGNGGIQHGKNGGGGGGGGGGPLNLRPGFPGPNPAPGTGGGGGRNEVHGAALDLLCALLLRDLEECSLSSVETWLSFS